MFEPAFLLDPHFVALLGASRRAGIELCLTLAASHDGAIFCLVLGMFVAVLTSGGGRCTIRLAVSPAPSRRLPSIFESGLLLFHRAVRTTVPSEEEEVLKILV